jgi:hypothetical protein
MSIDFVPKGPCDAAALVAEEIMDRLPALRFFPQRLTCVCCRVICEANSYGVDPPSIMRLILRDTSLMQIATTFHHMLASTEDHGQTARR